LSRGTNAVFGLDNLNLRYNINLKNMRICKHEY
jgi:hypothetical protein